MVLAMLEVCLPLLLSTSPSELCAFLFLVISYLVCTIFAKRLILMFFFADLCTGLQVCNAVGANVGKCVAVVTPGASCQSTVVAPAADGSGGKSIGRCKEMLLND